VNLVVKLSAELDRLKQELSDSHNKQNQLEAVLKLYHDALAKRDRKASEKLQCFLAATTSRQRPHVVRIEEA